jgi:hypothetical protein
MSMKPLEITNASVLAEKHRRAPVVPLVSTPTRHRFEQALTRASEGDGEDKPDTASPEAATSIAWPLAVPLQQRGDAMLNHAPITATPQASPTAQAVSTQLQQPTSHAEPAQTERLRVELSDPHLPLAAIDVQRIDSHVDVALLGHAATRTDISPMALGRLRERLAARGTDLGALTWTSHHHDEDEHDEH